MFLLEGKGGSDTGTNHALPAFAGHCLALLLLGLQKPAPHLQVISACQSCPKRVWAMKHLLRLRHKLWFIKHMDKLMNSLQEEDLPPSPLGLSFTYCHSTTELSGSQP